ncbi:MAG: thiamine phosphate synthase [Pseudomonadota bacterium]
MTEDTPQIYLVTPPDFELAAFQPRLSAVLDTHPVACLRLAMATRDEDRLTRAGDLLRDMAHARDIPLVIDQHWTLAERLGLDGVHLLDGARSVRAARKALGADAIVGAFAGASRHDGLSAGEAGADYIAFGPVTDTLGGHDIAAPELFQWWAEVIELPVVAEGGLDRDALDQISAHADFLSFGEEIWRADDPAAALGALLEALVPA